MLNSRPNEGDKTRIYREYERGKDYIEKLRLVSEIDEAYRFYEGDQWHGLKSGGERLAIYDVISPIVNYDVAVVTANLTEITYSSMNYDDPAFQAKAEEICRQLNAHAARWWENDSMDNVCFEVVEDACIARGKYIYFYYVKGKTEKRNGIDKEVEPGRIEHDMLDSPNIMFADEQERDIQRQPYILIPMRRRVSDIHTEAEQNRKDGKNKLKPDDIKAIASDDEKDLETGDRSKTEVEADSKDGGGKCLCIMKLWKKDGTVWISKATQSAVYLDPVSTGLKSYPVAGYVWSRVKGTCRGQGAVNKLVANQININRMGAYRWLNAKMTAFAKPIVDTAVVQNPEKVTEFGTQIEVDSTLGNGGLSCVLNAVGYLQPANTGPDAKNVQDELTQYTKDNAGATDVARGNMSNSNTAYHTVLAIQEAASATLNKQIEGLRRFVEDVAWIRYDMDCCYYPDGLQVVETQDAPVPAEQQGGGTQGQPAQAKQVEAYVTIPGDVLQKLKPRIKVDISAVNPYSKMVEEQKADNLLGTGLVNLQEYSMLLPDSEPMKARIERVVEAQGKVQQMIQMIQQLQQQNTALQQQAGAQNQALYEAGQAIHKTAAQGVEMATNAYNTGHLHGQIHAAANMPAAQIVAAPQEQNQEVNNNGGQSV